MHNVLSAYILTVTQSLQWQAAAGSTNQSDWNRFVPNGLQGGEMQACVRVRVRVRVCVCVCVFVWMRVYDCKLFLFLYRSLSHPVVRKVVIYNTIN